MLAWSSNNEKKVQSIPMSGISMHDQKGKWVQTKWAVNQPKSNGQNEEFSQKAQNIIK